jgi:hypothetical protein
LTPIPTRRTRSEEPIVLGATADGTFRAAIVACAVGGCGIGSPVGAAVPTRAAGLFAGLVAGFALVHARAEDP